MPRMPAAPPRYTGPPHIAPAPTAADPPSPPPLAHLPAAAPPPKLPPLDVAPVKVHSDGAVVQHGAVDVLAAVLCVLSRVVHLVGGVQGGWVNIACGQAMASCCDGGRRALAAKVRLAAIPPQRLLPTQHTLPFVPHDPGTPTTKQKPQGVSLCLSSPITMRFTSPTLLNTCGECVTTGGGGLWVRPLSSQSKY